LKQLTIERPN